jgi:hypothetical protein
VAEKIHKARVATMNDIITWWNTWSRLEPGEPPDQLLNLPNDPAMVDVLKRLREAVVVLGIHSLEVGHLVLLKVGVESGNPSENLLKLVTVDIRDGLQQPAAIIQEFDRVGVIRVQSDIDPSHLDSRKPRKTEPKPGGATNEVLGSGHSYEPVAAQLLQNRLGYCHVAHKLTITEPGSFVKRIRTQ